FDNTRQTTAESIYIVDGRIAWTRRFDVEACTCNKSNASLVSRGSWISDTSRGHFVKSKERAVTRIVDRILVSVPDVNCLRGNALEPVRGHLSRYCLAWVRQLRL